MFYLLWQDPIAAGHSSRNIVTMGVLFGVGIVWYVGMRLYRKSQGIQVDLAFQEIPIE